MSTVYESTLNNCISPITCCKDEGLVELSNSQCYATVGRSYGYYSAAWFFPFPDSVGLGGAKDSLNSIPQYPLQNIYGAKSGIQDFQHTKQTIGLWKTYSYRKYEPFQKILQKSCPWDSPQKT